MNTFRNKISAFLTAAMLMGGAAMTASLPFDTAYAKGNGGGGNGGGNAGSGGAERSDADMYPRPPDLLRFPSPRDLLPAVDLPGARWRGGPTGPLPGVFDPGRGSPAPRIDPARVPRGGPIFPLDPGLFPGLTPREPGIPAPPTVSTRARNVDRNGPVCDPFGVSVRSGIRTCGD